MNDCSDITVVSGNPWCLGGKPTGDGQRTVTPEPNVGPPGEKKHLEGMEQHPEEQFAVWEQMLKRVAAIRLAEANR
ncbi:hypothetical protein EYF80_052604 [Liparis tanakae]|uniref:Uncharacterized protein n=1 Tax=Liparis tanakae TaxID=230148 RepID=A0A4Z2F7T4_9TELE|nr:hypothetical protein EYF80_052604 [Liparis tanakae]